MPKKRANRADKEKPLITLQGVLRLEKSFVTAQHEEAQTVVIKKTEDAPPEALKLVPGESEHELVTYKAGYDVGPVNPLPQNEIEANLYEAQKKMEESQEAFEEMKRQSELERLEREKRFKEQTEPSLKEKSSVTSGNETEEKPVDSQESTFHPDDPNSYLFPESFLTSQGADIETPKAANDVESEPQSKSELLQEEFEEPLKPPGEEDEKSSEEHHEISKEMEEGLIVEDAGSMALSVAMEMEEKRKKEVRQRIAKGQENEQDHEELLCTLNEVTSESEERNYQGPDLSEQHIQEIVNSRRDENAEVVLASYWQFVRENPQDFNGWCYLIQHVENMNDIVEVRTVYNAFLPLYPYCFAYWQRYSEVERKHDNWERALAILHKGLEAIPLSVDLWISYLELYRKMYNDLDNFTELFRAQCEHAVQTVGLEYNSDILWESYIEWELEAGHLQWVTDIYKRLVAIPTRLYNKHWDNFIAHVRDHHPRDILDYDAYENLRKTTCEELGLTYRPDPIIQPAKPRAVVQPEDKLKVGMKERIVACVVNAHEKCEEEVDKRYAFEEKIKRPYFHVKPLDLKQLKNWHNYLDFEIEEGDHERIVVLFERCLIPCARYEQFWAKYARYLELHARKTNLQSSQQNGEKLSQDSNLGKARSAFGTGLGKVHEIREKRCTWTLTGWAEKDKDGKQIMVAAEVPIKEKEYFNKSSSNTEDMKSMESDSKEVSEKDSSNLDNEPSESDSKVDGSENTEEQSLSVPKEMDTSSLEKTKTDENTELEEEPSQQSVIDNEMSTVVKTNQDAFGLDAVRDVYQRACLVHCSKKAMIRLKWAAFEEECANLDKAKEILWDLNKQYPLLLECCLQLVDIERRSNRFDTAEEQYKQLLKKIPQNRKNVRTWLSLKLSRFQFKVRGQADRSLATLRAALKKDRGDSRIYSQIIDICYQRYPIDVKGVSAAIELAIKSPELHNMEKLDFVKRKVEFMQEFGSVLDYRDACDQLKTYRQICAFDLKLEAKKKKQEREQREESEELEIRTKKKPSQTKSHDAGYCPNCQTQMQFSGQRPSSGVKELKRSSEAEGGYGMAFATDSVAPEGVPEDEDDGIVDLMELEIPEDQEEQIRQRLLEKTKYKEVAPTWELNMETYGYGKKRKTYDPDYEHIEIAKFKEYERLETIGYDESIKDPDADKIKNLPAPGLGSKNEPKKTSEKMYSASDYVIPPKVPQLHQSTPRMIPMPSSSEAVDQEIRAFELPLEIADLQKNPCVNVPDWFVKDGGELCLSDTANGVSVLRYWPKFLSEKGNNIMFNRLRRYCKWHQKQIKIGGEWKYETRLVAWYGPCDYAQSGLSLEKNLNWAPELLDLLHRLISMTRHEFNCCFLNLYRHGHDMCGWHADLHPQLGRSPPVASVSLGTVRAFELRRKNGPPNFIRFPLYPGSLLLMEGAVQEDWLHCVPRDITCKDERINLTFRIMYSVDKRS